MGSNSGGSREEDCTNHATNIYLIERGGTRGKLRPVLLELDLGRCESQLNYLKHLDLFGLIQNLPNA